jgi:VWFA-related protein
MRHLLIPALLLSAASWLSLAQAQQPVPSSPQADTQSAPAPYVIHRNVSLVVLDGVAIDAQGNVVTDLKASDFRVTEDDVAQNIRDFTVPGRYMPPPNLTIDSTADLDRFAPRTPVDIMLLDEFNTHFEDMAFGRYSLEKWLNKQPGKLTNPTMLVAVSLEKFIVLRDYTQDKDQILSALKHHFAAYPWQAQSGGWIAERYAAAFNTLRRVAEATNGHSGHKNMIWIGRGFPNIDVARYPPDIQEKLRATVEQTVDELQEARVTLYTVDPAGLTGDPGAYGADAADFAPFGGDPNFEALSRATGGRSLHGRNDVDAQIGTAIRDGQNLFSISYSPNSVSDEPSKFRNIKVTIERPGVKFLTRQGYYPVVSIAKLDANDKKMDTRLASEMIDASISNMAYDGIAFIAEVLPNDTSTIRVRVDGHGLVYDAAEGTNLRTTHLVVLVSSFDAKDRHIKNTAGEYTFQAPSNTDPAVNPVTPVGFDFKLDPEPKATHFRMVVRVNGTSRMGTADIVLNPGFVGHSATVQMVPTTQPTPASTGTPPAH